MKSLSFISNSVQKKKANQNSMRIRRKALTVKTRKPRPVTRRTTTPTTTTSPPVPPTSPMTTASLSTMACPSRPSQRPPKPATRPMAARASGPRTWSRPRPPAARRALKYPTNKVEIFDIIISFILNRI